MKITNKTLMVNFETEVKLGNNDAIELTLQHIAFISENKDGSVSVDLDLGVDLPAQLMQWVELDKLNIIGTSGSTSHKNFPAFSKLGINGFESFVSDYFIIANANVKPEVVVELNNILQTSIICN
jgi:hypothetical protein